MINNLVNENISSISSLSKTWEIMKFMLLYAAVRSYNIKVRKRLLKNLHTKSVQNTVISRSLDDSAEL